MNIIGTIASGFFFAIGAILAWAIFQLFLFLLREWYIAKVIKKLKTNKVGKPKGMEFGKEFNV